MSIDKNPHEASSHGLAEVRQEIDSLDRQIFELLMARSGLIDRVKRSKTGASLPLRPDREVAQMQQLIDWHSQANTNMPIQGLIAIWRQIIASSIAQQGGMTIMTCPATHNIAEAHFGASLSYHAHMSADAAIAGVEPDKTVAVTDIESLGAWVEQLPAGLKVVARLPVMGTAQALCWAYLEVAPQADDVILLFGADLPAGAQTLHTYANGKLGEVKADVQFDAAKYQVLGRYANLTDNARQSQ
ncbi:chorismate mutase [Alphaproteobacteria bacterium]|nr:chorismate mutase [Alphaproteobacteria bacterium]